MTDTEVRYSDPDRTRHEAATRRIEQAFQALIAPIDPVAEAALREYLYWNPIQAQAQHSDALEVQIILRRAWAQCWALAWRDCYETMVNPAGEATR